MGVKFLKDSLRLDKLSLITRDWIQDKENAPILSYLNRGYFKTSDDLYDLHRACSPYKVPIGLTGLQVRRRINKFRKGGSKLENPFADTHRIEIFVDGKFISGTTYGRPVSNHKELVTFLTDLLKVMKSPKRKIKDNL